MRKILSQDEIDALFSAASQSGKAGADGKQKKIEPCDLRKSSTLSAEQVRVVTTLHESLARRLGNSLGAYLRVGFEMNLVSAEQLTYVEFISRVPELTYLASVRILPLDARAAIQADLSLVFPIVDLVLGGSGADLIEPRDLTEIEEEIFETVVTLIARGLQITWAPVIELDIQFDQRQQYAQVQSLMLPNEKILSLSFEIKLPDSRGTLNMAFPAVVANALLRKLSTKWSYSERIPSRETRQRIRQRLLDSSFEAELSLQPSPFSIRELVGVEPGRILMLPKRANEPILLNIAGKSMFAAYPVRQGTQRGARIARRNSIATNKGRELK
jgi:flagellar motor switch protein FliM